MNKVILIGRTTRDVELRRTSTGTAVATFTLAVDNRYVQKDGKPTADFISCVAWRNTAEFMEKYIKKGALVAVEGRIQTRNYDNKDGNRVYVTEVVVENLQALESKNASERNNGGNNYDDYEPTNTRNSNSNEAYNEPSMDNGLTYDINDDDLPF